MNPVVNLTLDAHGRVECLEVPQGVTVHVSQPSRRREADFDAAGADPTLVPPKAGADVSTLFFSFEGFASLLAKAPAAAAHSSFVAALVTPTVVPIPAGTYAAGDHTLGGAGGFAVPVGATDVTVNFDMGAYPATESVNAQAWVSLDGGVTWRDAGSAQAPGGPRPTDGGGTTTVFNLDVAIGGDPNSTLRRAKAVVTPTAPLTPAAAGTVTAA